MTDTSSTPAVDEIADDSFEDLGTTPTTDADNHPVDSTEETAS